MTEERETTHLSAVSLACAAACVLAASASWCGCATPGMRAGVAQARYELERAKGLFGTGDAEAGDGRLERARTVLAAWQEAYGKAGRAIDDTSLYPVLEQMGSERTLVTGAEAIIGNVPGDTGWLESILGLLAAILGTGGARLWLANRRHKKEKAILMREIEREENPDLKTRIARRVAEETPFGREVASATDR